MKVIKCCGYGPPEVLQLAEVDKPQAKANEILIKNKATAVTASDIFIRSSNLPLRYKIPMRMLMGIFKPRKPILGLVFAGEIEAVGKDIKRFKVGDEIYGFTGFSMGAYAEYLCLKEKSSTFGCVVRLPANINYEEVTTMAYGGLLALQYLEKGNIKPGDNVLIYGASGNSGTIAVQLAKSFGANVTGVCSTANIEMVKSLGADEVIDYTTQDDFENGEQFGYVFDMVGTLKNSTLKKNCKKALVPNGKYISIDDGDLILSSERLERLNKMYEQGSFKPIVDRVYDFENMVEAHTYVEKGHKKGGVAIKFN